VPVQEVSSNLPLEGDNKSGHKTVETEEGVCVEGGGYLWMLVAAVMMGVVMILVMLFLRWMIMILGNVAKRVLFAVLAFDWRRVCVATARLLVVLAFNAGLRVEQGTSYVNAMLEDVVLRVRVTKAQLFAVFVEWWRVLFAGIEEGTRFVNAMLGHVAQLFGMLITMIFVPAGPPQALLVSGNSVVTRIYRLT
jgi:hypothetical protein